MQRDLHTNLDYKCRACSVKASTATDFSSQKTSFNAVFEDNYVSRESDAAACSSGCPAGASVSTMMMRSCDQAFLILTLICFLYIHLRSPTLKAVVFLIVTSMVRLLTQLCFPNVSLTYLFFSDCLAYNGTRYLSQANGTRPISDS